MYLEAKVAIQHLVEPRRGGRWEGTLTRNLSQETGSGCHPAPILHFEYNPTTYSVQFWRKGITSIKEFLSRKTTSRSRSGLCQNCKVAGEAAAPTRREPVSPSEALSVRQHKGKVWNPRDCREECAACLATFKAGGWNPGPHCPSETAD